MQQAKVLWEAFPYIIIYLEKTMMNYIQETESKSRSESEDD